MYDDIIRQRERHPNGVSRAALVQTERSVRGIVVADGEETPKTMEPEDARGEWGARSTGPRNVDIGLWDWTETRVSVSIFKF